MTDRSPLPMNKTKKRGDRKEQKNDPSEVGLIREKLLQLFSAGNGRAYTYRELVQKLSIKDKKSKDHLGKQIALLERKNKIRKGRDGRYVNLAVPGTIQGEVDHVNPHFAFVLTPEGEDDIRVRTTHLKYAVHGDIVNVQLTKLSQNSFRPEGKVVNIVKRSRNEFVGRIEILPKYAFVIPDNRNIHFDVFVYPEKIGKAKTNDKVLVKISRWHNANIRNPVGEVIEVLGRAGENEAEMHSIMAEFGLPFRFEKKIEKAAQKIRANITKEEIAKRRDFRPVPTFTVDPSDAKDFDDALSIRALGRDRYEIGIHIADVTHYVREGSALDQEAADRATSVYLVDRTVPMLPEQLSNELCSLRPDEEKLTFSAVFEIDRSGRVLKKWFGKTIIISDRRFTYEEAQEHIEGLEGDFSDEIVILDHIAKKLKARRIKNGAVNFETIEVKFLLDEAGKPLKVIPKERKDAHKMIEEFMLLANFEVAARIRKWKGKDQKAEGRTFVYRVHDDPDPEKLDTFASFVAKFGYKLELNNGIANGLNKLMSKIERRPEQYILESLALRCMAKAKYTTDPRGHFGLAFDHYTHFTSPIRRYPDMMVHRLFQHYLDNGRTKDREAFERLCLHSSEREKRAVEAERASVKYKQVEYMENMPKQVFEGIVSGVTEWGIFVEIIKTKCEGMIRISSLDDDYYVFDEKNLRVIGKNNKRIITLGDRVQVVVARTDIDRRTIDLEIVMD